MPINKLANGSGLLPFGKMGGGGITPPSGFTGLLDEYPNARFAYSTRRLSGSYTGALLEVRRSSDNAVQDIGYDSNGELDTTALTTFVGAGNGFVRTWYDQSGNGDDVQNTTASGQPQIVSGGTVLTEGGKPTLDHASTHRLKLTTAAVDIGTSYAMFAAVNFDAVNKEIFGNDGATYSYGIYAAASSHNHGANGTFGSATGGFGTAWALYSQTRAGTVSISQYKDGVILGSAFNMGANNSFFFNNLSGESGTLFPLDGKLSEAIVYNTDQTSNRTGIESNISTYFSTP